jgi:hypothetical protein
MIFFNPAGAPELACDECGCRWYDRVTVSCYECGTPATPQAQAQYREALEAFAADKGSSGHPLASERKPDQGV